MSDKSQSFENHTKIVPLYHGFVLIVFGINVVSAVVHLVRAPSVSAGIAVLVAVALVMAALFARVFALAVQDRVIRLEMRLRLRDLLRPDQQATIPQFTVGQLVALRFASDEELPALAATVLRDNIKDKKTIKKMIKNWQADHQRA
jgi:hypothetical protein